jgi:hypothetical protein
MAGAHEFGFDDPGNGDQEKVRSTKTQAARCHPQNSVLDL